MSIWEDFLSWLEEWWLMVVLFAVIGAFIFMCAVAMLQDQKDWETFSIKHNCKLIEVKASTTGYGYGVTTDGKVGTGIITNPEQKCYICDDSIKYWR